MFQQLFGNNPIFLAPMAGVTNLPFRFFCREQGANAVITEFVSVLSLYHTLKHEKMNENSVRWLIQSVPEEKPVGLQVFGFNPNHFEQLATLPSFIKILDNFDFFELNVGCPVPKICNSGAGSRLLSPDHLPVLENIINIVKKTIPEKPFSLKIRAGYQSVIDIKKFSEILNSFDLLMITIHPRLAINSYQDKANHELTQQLVDDCDHPIIANGSINSLESAKKLQHETGAAGTMIGRVARRYPWVFSPKHQKIIKSKNFINNLHYFLDLSEKFGYPNVSFLRGQLVSFIRGFAGSSQFRNQIHLKVKKFEDFRMFVNKINTSLDTKGILEIQNVVV